MSYTFAMSKATIAAAVYVRSFEVHCTNIENYFFVTLCATIFRLRNSLRERNSLLVARKVWETYSISGTPGTSVYTEIEQGALM